MISTAGPGPIDLDEQVLTLLREASGRHLTGGALSERLFISRATVARHVHKLREQGYEIEAHPDLGYRLISSPDLLLSQEVRHGLKSQIMGRQVLSYQRVRSTNGVALQIANSGAPEGTLVVAEEQTAGRGRLGRSWYSPPGVGLWFSLVLRPRVAPSHVFQLAICGALAVAEAIYRKTHLPVRVKWPNDVLIEGKKLAGVLTEAQLEGDKVHFVILGVGINVNQTGDHDFPQSLRARATSLRVELGREVSRTELLREILLQFEGIYGQFHDLGLSPFLDRWRQLSWVLGRQVVVQVGEKRFSGLVVDIEDTGALILEMDSGNRQRLLAGDVSLT